MCGIAGIVGGDLGAEARLEIVRRMCDAMLHRGPDDSGEHADAQVGLGMRRLSIVDLAGGRQPMLSRDGRFRLVFNGEIYNHRALRASLSQRGEAFDTASDTEVLLRQLEVRGRDGIKELNGMFGFALWDEATRCLLLGRDRLGVKPLYYHWDGRTLLFASEIKALLASGLVERVLEPRALWDYLTFRYIPPPLTIWRDVFKLPPGHLLDFRPGRGAPDVRRYWDIPYGGSRRAIDDRVLDREFGELFEDAVRLRLLADVPVGIMLSGGLDSSAVAAAARSAAAGVETFSIGFKGAPDANELAHARHVAEYLGCRHNEIEIDDRDYVGFLGDFVRMVDEPMSDPASIPLYYVSRLAADRVKVVLSGEGSDEVLGGYDFDLWVKAWDRQRAAQAVPVPSVFGRLRRLWDADHGKPEVDLRQGWPPPNMTNYMDGSAKSRLLPGFAFPDSMQWIADDLSRLGPQPTLHQMLYVFSQSWLAEDLLMKADKMSMACSIELRTPFLDYRLVEWAARTPPEAKVGPGPGGELTTKRILRRYAQGRLPRSIIDRPKQGFPVPLYGWLAGRLAGWAEDLLLGPSAALRGLADPGELRRLLDLGTAPEGQVLDRHRLWNLLVLELWMREWRPA